MKIKSLLKLMLVAVSALPCLCAYATTASTDSNHQSTVQATQSTDKAMVPDKKLTEHVKKKIAEDKAVSKLPVDLSTLNGVVILTGNVDTDEEAGLIIEKASSVHGVKDVDGSKLVIKKSTQPFTDTTITGKVKGAFLREKVFGKKKFPMMSVIVETTNGTVYLSGTAATQAQIDTAVALAKKVSGVQEVKSSVQVKS